MNINMFDDQTMHLTPLIDDKIDSKTESLKNVLVCSCVVEACHDQFRRKAHRRRGGADD